MPIKTLTPGADASLFLDFLDPALSLIDLAIRHDIPLDDILDWAESPDTRARLARLHNLNVFRNTFLATGALPAALASLSAAATRTPSPDADPALAQRTAESARRAAAQLARLAAQATPRAASAPAPQASSAIDDAAPESDAAMPVHPETKAPLTPASDSNPDPTHVYTSSDAATTDSKPAFDPPSDLAPAIASDTPSALVPALIPTVAPALAPGPPANHHSSASITNTTPLSSRPPLKSEIPNFKSQTSDLESSTSPPLPSSPPTPPFAAAPIPRAAAHPDGWS